MSESDYQRGLRGGPCRVSISDWERYSDWKAGHDEYERQQDALDEERIMQFLTPEEKAARIDERIRTRANAEAYFIAQEGKSEIEEKQKKVEERKGNLTKSITLGILIGIIGLIIGALGGGLLGFVIWLVLMIFGNDIGDSGINTIGWTIGILCAVIFFFRAFASYR